MDRIREIISDMDRRYAQIMAGKIPAGYDRPRIKSRPRVESPYLTADEAAVYCRVSKKTIYNQRRYIARQPGVGKLLFTKADLDKWLSTRSKRR